MDNVLYQNNRIVLFAQYGDPQIHRHFSKHILLSDVPFVCLTEEKAHKVCSALIQSQVAHSVRQDGQGKMVVFLIDDTCDLSKHLDRLFLQGQDFCPLPSEAEQSLFPLLRGDHSLEEIDEALMAALACRESARQMDERICAALQYISCTEDLGPQIYDLLPKRLCLSKSRFFHLFKQEVGIDLKNYLLLKRLEKVYDCVVQKHMRITEAAIRSGFSSSSHFSAACKAHYGISLTDFLKSQKIQRSNESN